MKRSQLPYHSHSVVNAQNICDSIRKQRLRLLLYRFGMFCIFLKAENRHDKHLEVLQYMTKIQLAWYLAEDLRQAALYQRFLLRHYHQMSH